MVSNCPERFLRHELAILKPGTVLVLGKRTLRGLRVEKRYLLFKDERGDVRIERIEFAGLQCDFVTIVHPGAFGGTSKSLGLRLAEAILTRRSSPLGEGNDAVRT